MIVKFKSTQNQLHSTQNGLNIKLFIVLFSVALFIVAPIQAQKDTEPQEYQTLFGNNVSHGGYGGLSLGYTKIGENNAFNSGIKGAWVIGHGIGIGMAFNGIIAEMETDIIPNQEFNYISAGYGGLLIEPILFGLKPIHLSMPILIGTGAVVFYYGDYNQMSYNEVPWKQFFVIEPAIELEMNVTRFFRLSLGGSYRFTSDTDMTVTVLNESYNVVGANDLNNFSLYLSFKFGKF